MGNESRQCFVCGVYVLKKHFSLHRKECDTELECEKCSMKISRWDIQVLVRILWQTLISLSHLINTTCNPVYIYVCVTNLPRCILSRKVCRQIANNLIELTNKFLVYLSQLQKAYCVREVLFKSKLETCKTILKHCEKSHLQVNKCSYPVYVTKIRTRHFFFHLWKL